MMTKNNIADDQVFVFMALKVTTKMCWKRLQVHITGKGYKNKNSVKKVKFFIVTFKSWKSGQRLYNARPRIVKKKSGRNFTI